MQAPLFVRAKDMTYNELFGELRAQLHMRRSCLDGSDLLSLCRWAYRADSDRYVAQWWPYLEEHAARVAKVTFYWGEDMDTWADVLIPASIRCVSTQPRRERRAVGSGVAR